MKTVSVSLIALALATSSSAFQSTAPRSSTIIPSITSTTLNEYVPDGFTKASYEKFKKTEAAKKRKNLGNLGPKGFKSRSFQSFQEALERGETSHLMPVMNAKERVKKGELRKEDIPYMQRGGAWDNSDVRGAKRGKWLKSDKEYASGGYKKEQSVSIFGVGQGLDWTGSRGKTGPAQNQKGKVAKKGAAAASASSESKPKKNGFFGLF